MRPFFCKSQKNAVNNFRCVSLLPGDYSSDKYVSGKFSSSAPTAFRQACIFRDGPSRAIIYYNSAILSRLLAKYEASGNAKALALITQLSPAAWRHILLNGHYTFNTDGKVIDLDAIVAALDLG